MYFNPLYNLLQYHPVQCPKYCSFCFYNCKIQCTSFCNKLILLHLRKFAESAFTCSAITHSAICTCILCVFPTCRAYHVEYVGILLISADVCCLAFSAIATQLNHWHKLCTFYDFKQTFLMTFLTFVFCWETSPSLSMIVLYPEH